MSSTAMDRRSFLGLVAAGAIQGSLMSRTSAQQPQPPRKKMAIVTTEWRYHSHAWHMGERFLVGYPILGKWHRPGLELVAAYVDQKPENDLSRQRAAEFGFTIYPTIAEALRQGGNQLAVDAVLIIGEHGEYPADPQTTQVLYPRRKFIDEVATTFRKVGQIAPVLSDMHLSAHCVDARAMYDTARDL